MTQMALGMGTVDGGRRRREGARAGTEPCANLGLVQTGTATSFHTPGWGQVAAKIDVCRTSRQILTLYSRLLDRGTTICICLTLQRLVSPPIFC